MAYSPDRDGRPFLDWQPSFSLGVADLDAQHRQLLDLVNAFAAAVVDQFRLADAVAGLEVLIARSRAHFDFEEALMRRIDFPDLRVHREQHSELLASMERLRQQLVGLQPAVNTPRTLDFLSEWFLTHIMYSDRALARFIKSLPTPP